MKLRSVHICVVPPPNLCWCRLHQECFPVCNLFPALESLSWSCCWSTEAWNAFLLSSRKRSATSPRRTVCNGLSEALKSTTLRTLAEHTLRTRASNVAHAHRTRARRTPNAPNARARCTKPTTNHSRAAIFTPRDHLLHLTGYILPGHDHLRFTLHSGVRSAAAFGGGASRRLAGAGPSRS